MGRGRPKLTQRQALQNKLVRLEKEIAEIEETLKALPVESDPLPVKEPEIKQEGE